MWKLSKWILVIILTCTNGYDWKCPHSSQWNFTSRSFECSEQNIYVCLFDASESNGSKAVFTGKCGHLDVSREGFKYILAPDLNQVPCTASRYQPFTFTTDGNSQCVFSKSLCTASGQILAHNGSSLTDISCRCDYRQNYDYVIPPKDPCSCRPAEEDCSCYIRKCDGDKVMIADYRCMKRVETILPQDIKCPIISRIIPPEKTDTVDKIQLQSVVTGSSTWWIQASVILIVVIIIYAVLIGFLFFSVPHVTSILLILKFQLPVKNKENKFMILNGDNVKIECNVNSYIPVRSVTWQKEINGEITQITSSMEQYELVLGENPSLTINNFNTDDQGKYRCIIRNAVGLRNDMFGSCMNLMSRVGWLTGFVTVLQHIPAFHTDDIALHTDDFEQSEPKVYTVYKGGDITMEQHIDGQQKLISVKWFKESDIWTELDLSNEQYSGGVTGVPSLTIKITTFGNAGKYCCLLIYDNGERQKALFKLKIIPEVKFYKALCDHREDKTFIRPAIFETIDKHMQENNIVVITGREGSGKSKICLELASIYDEKDYMVVKVDLSENHSIDTDIGNALLIIDDQQYTQDSLNTYMKHLLPVLPERNIKVILSCRYLDLEIVSSVYEIISLKGEPFIDINSCLTPEEKEEMLRRYIKENNIAISMANVSNLGNPEIITDLSVQVTLADDTIKVIRNEEPWKGFPLSAALFCSERKFLHLGEKYFTNPPKQLVEELKELYEAARKTSNCKDKINEYCVLVYIMNNNNHQLDLNDPNLCSQLDKIYQTCFHFKNKPEKPGSNEDQKIAIEEAVHKMNNKFTKFHEGVYEFINPCLLKAMFLSSKSIVPYLLEKGSLHDITEFVRSEVYTALKDELVIKIDEEYRHTLCERLVRHAFENRELLIHVSQYIYSYWHSSDNYLVNEMFRYIEFILFRSLEVHTGDHLSLDHESLSENSIKLLDLVQFFKVTMLVDELTFKGRDPWIYGPSSGDFLILSALVSAAMKRYATDSDKTFRTLMEEFQNRIHLKSFVKLWSKPLDRYGNTFFHYLMGLNQKTASTILSVHAEMKYTFDTENAKKYTPLDIAAFLGKIDIFKVLNLKTSNCTHKLRKRLKRLAKSGKDEYFNENFKNKNIYKSVIDKTKDDGASPAKLEHEDADDEKKEEDENNKNISFFKRKLRSRKEESNEKENHDKRDVLCFEDFMLNVVVNGGEDDYQSIIKLFSKHLI